MTPEQILENIAMWASTHRTLHETVTQQILPHAHWGPEKSELIGAMSCLESVLRDIDAMLRGEELDSHVIEIEIPK